MKSKNLVMAAIGVIFAATGVFFGLRHTTPVPPQSAAADQFFSQTLNDANGQPQQMAQWKNKTLVVNFWATWCPPCVDEMPELSALQSEFQRTNVQILGIGIDSPANISQFAAKHNISYPLYTGGMNGTELSRQFGNQAGGLPFTVIIDKNGSIKKVYLGRLKMDELRKDLAAL